MPAYENSPYYKLVHELLSDENLMKADDELGTPLESHLSPRVRERIASQIAIFALEQTNKTMFQGEVNGLNLALGEISGATSVADAKAKTTWLRAIIAKRLMRQ